MHTQKNTTKIKNHRNNKDEEAENWVVLLLLALVCTHTYVRTPKSTLSVVGLRCRAPGPGETYGTTRVRVNQTNQSIYLWRLSCDSDNIYYLVTFWRCLLTVGTLSRERSVLFSIFLHRKRKQNSNPNQTLFHCSFEIFTLLLHWRLEWTCRIRRELLCKRIFSVRKSTTREQNLTSFFFRFFCRSSKVPGATGGRRRSCVSSAISFCRKW